MPMFDTRKNWLERVIQQPRQDAKIIWVECSRANEAHSQSSRGSSKSGGDDQVDGHVNFRYLKRPILES